jgi:GH35 family endo-1,4-beta-xylanase
MTIKSAALAKGVRIGAGLFDIQPDDPPHFPAILDAAADPIANIIQNQLGGGISLAIGVTWGSEWGPPCGNDQWVAARDGWGPFPYNFNGTVVGGVLQPTGGAIYMTNTDAAYAWAKAHGITPHLQGPMYPSGAPPWVVGYWENYVDPIDGPSQQYVASPYSDAQKRAMIDAYITAVFSRYPTGGHVDLFNEVLAGWDQVWRQGGYIAQGLSFVQMLAHFSQLVRAANPGINILVNHNVLPNWIPGSATYNMSGTPIQIAQQIVAAGGVVDGIGWQGHIGSAVDTFGASPGLGVQYGAQAAAAFDAVAAAGFKLYILEFDIRNGDASAAACAKSWYAGFLAHRAKFISNWYVCDPMWEGSVGCVWTARPGLQAKWADAIEQAVNEATPFLTLFGDVVGGTVTMSGARPPGETVALTVPPGATCDPVSYDPAGVLWSCVVRGLTGVAPITATSSVSGQTDSVRVDCNATPLLMTYPSGVAAGTSIVTGTRPPGAAVTVTADAGATPGTVNYDPAGVLWSCAVSGITAATTITVAAGGDPLKVKVDPATPGVGAAVAAPAAAALARPGVPTVRATQGGVVASSDAEVCVGPGLFAPAVIEVCVGPGQFIQVSPEVIH